VSNTNKEGSLVVDLNMTDRNTNKERGNEEKKKNDYRCQTKNLLYTPDGRREKPDVTQ
jgi:hypothetical protein